MEHTLESLKACLPPAAEYRPHPKPRAPLHRKPNITVPAPTDFVDLHDDDDVDEEHEADPCQTNKRIHANMEEKNHVYVRNYKTISSTRAESIGGDRSAPNPARATHPPSIDREGPPSRPIRVTPIATRWHSPNRNVFRPARSYAANVLPETPLPYDTPSDDMVAGLRRDRHVFVM